MTQVQSDEAYSDWMDLREAEDVLDAQIAEQEEAKRWHEFQRDDGEEDSGPFTSATSLAKPGQTRPIQQRRFSALTKPM